MSVKGDRRLILGTMSEDTDEPITLDDPQVLELREGDVLIVYTAEGVLWPASDLKHAQETLRELLDWPDVIMASGVDRMEVVRKVEE